MSRARPDEPLAHNCQAAIGGVCTIRPVTERHHVQRRSQGGTDDASNTVDCCKACHDFIHANPAEAKRLGLLLPAGQPAKSIILHRRQNGKS